MTKPQLVPLTFRESVESGAALLFLVAAVALLALFAVAGTVWAYRTVFG